MKQTVSLNLPHQVHFKVIVTVGENVNVSRNQVAPGAVDCCTPVELSCEMSTEVVLATPSCVARLPDKVAASADTPSPGAFNAVLAGLAGLLVS